MFDNGAGVEVVDNQGFMTARVFLPWSFIVSTSFIKNNLDKFSQKYVFSFFFQHVFSFFIVYFKV